MKVVSTVLRGGRGLYLKLLPLPDVTLNDIRMPQIIEPLNDEDADRVRKHRDWVVGHFDDATAYETSFLAKPV